MASYNIPSSVQEAAAEFANNIASMLNVAAAEAAGVDVMWFKLLPDKRNQDVIFQTYTLYGVKDCPLEFKAVYSDTGYDDAAITYNIMGLEYSVPLTLEIPVNTWYEVTEYDGSLPQRGDIVFIPISNKLVEVVSMTPVKAIGSQITSFKVNCSVYKPTRSRIVGENLKTTIEENTVNLESQFGKDIDSEIKDIIDDNQLSLLNSTPKDPYKNVEKSRKDDNTLISNRTVNCIKSYDLQVDGHIVARTYYDANIDSPVLVSYNIEDTIQSDDERCYSCWFCPGEYEPKRNIKSISPIEENGKYYLDIVMMSGKRPVVGENVVIERGNIVICGTIIEHNNIRVEIHKALYTSLNNSLPNWYNLPGFTLRKDNIIYFLNASGPVDVIISLKGANYISIKTNDKEILCQLSTRITERKWYGIIINLSKQIGIDLFTSDPELKHIYTLSEVNNPNWTEGTFKYFIKSSNVYITNIRLYKTSNYELDKQILDMVSYNVLNNSYSVINDSADTYLNKTYIGKEK